MISERNRAGYGHLYRMGDITKRYGVGVASVGLALFFVGCGGSGGGGGLSPHQTIRSSALATYQTVGGLSVYPITALETAAPPGSDITAVPTVAATRDLTEVHHTGLFSAGATPTSTGAIFKYFTNALGTTSAGSMTITSPVASFKYTKYPATVNVAINVTAGNLPCMGTAKIVFQDSSGASEISGSMTLRKNKELVTFDLFLDSSHNVTGSMQIVENGISIADTNINGPLVGDQSMNFSLSPSGYAGTGTIDLISPTITLLFSNPSGASVSIDSSHHMVIHYGDHPVGGSDGDDEDIEDPIIQFLLGDSGDTSDDSGDTSGDTSSGDSSAGSTGSTTSGTTGDDSSGDDGSCDTAYGKTVPKAPATVKSAPAKR